LLRGRSSIIADEDVAKPPRDKKSLNMPGARLEHLRKKKMETENSQMLSFYYAYRHYGRAYLSGPTFFGRG
jgi:hypothetical protein